MKTEITKDSLLAFGMAMTGDPVHPMSKTLGESEEGKLSIAVTRMYNIDQIALFMPDGGALYLGPASIEDLQAFEKMILHYEPNY